MKEQGHSGKISLAALLAALSLGLPYAVAKLNLPHTSLVGVALLDARIGIMVLVPTLAGVVSTIVTRFPLLATLIGYSLLTSGLARGGVQVLPAIAFLCGILLGAIVAKHIGLNVHWSHKSSIRLVRSPSLTRALYCISITLVGMGVFGLLAEQIFTETFGNSMFWAVGSLFASTITGLMAESRSIATLSGLLSLMGPSWIAIALLARTTGVPCEYYEHNVGVPIGTRVGELSERKRGLKEATGLLHHINELTSGKWVWSAADGMLRLDPFRSRNPHMLIFGESGSGKSTLAKALAVEFHKQGASVTVLDFHGEYASLSRYGFKVLDAKAHAVNPLELCGESPRARALELSFTLARVFSLGTIQRSILLDVIREAYEERGIYEDKPETWSKPAPTFLDLNRVIKRRIELTSRREEAARLESLYRYLSLLEDFLPEGREENRKQALLNESAIVNLSNLPSEGVQSLYADVMLREIYARYARKASRPKKSTVIILDEAHRLTREQSASRTLRRLLAESRKYGMAVILISQSPLDFSQNIASNASTKISFRVSEARSLDYATKILTPVLESTAITLIKNTLKNLPVGFAIVSYERETKNNLINNLLTVVQVQQSE